MNLNVEISDQKVENLSDSGKSKLEKLGKNYIDELLDEAERIEIARNTSNTDPEITASIIQDADTYIKRFRLYAKPRKGFILLQIIAFISTLITGGIFDTGKFNSLEYLIIFLVLFSICVVSTIFSMVLGGKNGS